VHSLREEDDVGSKPELQRGSFSETEACQEAIAIADREEMLGKRAKASNVHDYFVLTARILDECAVSDCDYSFRSHCKYVCRNLLSKPT
jgi:hypothetical protein